METKSDVLFGEYVAKKIRAQANEKAALAKAMNLIARSDAGEELFKLIAALIDGFKDDAVWQDDDKLRLQLRGSILALQAVVSTIAELASEHESESEEGPNVWEQPAWATSTVSDEA